MNSKLFIGVTANYDHPDPERHLYTGKRLAYVETSMWDYVIRNGCVPVLLAEGVAIEDTLGGLDGLLISGGADVAPESYGATPIDADRWPGDPYRDREEIAWVQYAQSQRLPVLGICRGAQVLNVAAGGTLIQDIASQRPDAIAHRDADLYDQCIHPVSLEGWLKALYGIETARVNSVHHQAVLDMAPGFETLATSTQDNIVEAIRWSDDSWFALGVQWHPEFITTDQGCLDPKTIFDAFKNACLNRKST